MIGLSRWSFLLKNILKLIVCFKKYNYKEAYTFNEVKTQIFHVPLMR